MTESRRTTGAILTLLLAAGLPLRAEPLTLRTLAQGPYSGIRKAEKVVIRSQAEWDKLRTRHRAAAPALEAPPEKDQKPKVDWSKEMVLAVFLGQRPSAGYKVEIREVVEAKDRLVVKVTETRPPPGAITASVLTFPYHLVVVKSSGLPVTWE